MNLTNGSIITLNDNKQYLIIDNLIEAGDKYLFTNELKNDDLTEQYYILKVLDMEVSLITDETLINDLLPKFREKLNKTINEHLY